MKKGIVYPVSRIKVDLTLEGESIEEQLRKMVAGKEPIQATAKVAYTERKDGVHAEYDIRTDRFELAMQAADRVHATQYAARMTADGFIQNEKGQWVPAPPKEKTAEA